MLWLVPTVEKFPRGQKFLLGDRIQATALDILEALIEATYSRDLFSPYERRRGLSIGNLTSQFFANLYLDPLDHFATEVLHAPYVRYVDDFALFHDDPAKLSSWRERIARFLEKRRLRLQPHKTFVTATSEPARFLGFVLLAPGWRRLPEDNIRRFRNRLRSYDDQRRARTMPLDETTWRIQSWVAHASHANTWRLRTAIFRTENRP